MSSEVKYTPLSPVYKGVDEEIALEDFSAPKPVDDVKSSSEDCPKQEDSCCRKNAKKRPCCVRVIRCLCVTMFVGLCLWLITGTAVLTYIGAKAHRCLHPRHVATQEFTWIPSSVPSLELGLVSGNLNIRSCPRAKNVTLTVRTYAGTEDLLNTMVLQRDVVNGAERVVLLAPSFDWAHCQRAVFDLVVPEGAGIDVKAQGLLGKIEVHAAKSAVRNLVVATSVAHVSVQSSVLSGSLRIESELGVVRAREVTVQGDVKADLRTGFLDIRELTSLGSVHTTLRHGCAKIYHVDAKTEFVHASELAYVSLWNVDAPNLNARVDYGGLTAAVSNHFAGHFIARSPYGFLKANHGKSVASRYHLDKETLALIEGSVEPEVTATQATPPVAEKTVTLDAVYGSIEIFVPDPETKWERKHHSH